MDSTENVLRVFVTPRLTIFCYFFGDSAFDLFLATFVLFALVLSVVRVCLISKVLIDIFIREITNLDTKDVMRTDYLQTLSLLLNRSSWVAKGGRYRRSDISQCLESILDVGGDGIDGYEEKALETVEIVLNECAAILEE